jgi:hypothetical protein
MRASLSVACVLILAGCGGGSEPARSAHDEPGSATERPGAPAQEEGERHAAAAHPGAPEIEVQGEVGGLDQDAVNRVVQSASRDIDRCWDRGVARNELVSGSIQIVLGIGGTGRAAYSFVERSSLGENEMERCMLKSLTDRTFPKPVGGKVGIVRTSFSFELDKATRAPVSWGSSQVSDALAGAADPIAACKRGASQKLTATVYVKEVELPPPPVEETDAGDAGADANEDAGPTYVGRAISVGIAAPDEQSWAAAECLERALSQIDYPTPGGWPAKVSFEL